MTASDNVSDQPSANTGKPVKPRKAVVVLLDSLNRHMLGCYGGTEFQTPNLDRFAAMSKRFTSHYTGSLPCMPARHDILVGALDFLWRPWGSIELWERPLTHDLRKQGVVTQLFSDHPHLFETGGENYHTEFSAWDYLRGHESDPWRTRADPSWLGAPALPARSRAGAHEPHGYDLSRSWFRSEAEFPGPRTMQATADWLTSHGNAHDSFMLFVDEFDPHEPFDTPAPWANMYDPDWDEELMIWPPYAVGAVEKGILTERQARHIRANYGAKLTMTDHWFGKILDAMDQQDLWKDTVFILCTDHGHYLGERDIFGKPGVMQYETLGHTPLMIHYPGVAAGTVDALTTNVDIYQTLADLFGAQPAHRTHGKSLLPLVRGEQTQVREYAIGGIYGNWVQIQDGRHKYARAPVTDNFPLSMWSNRWSTMPVAVMPNLRLPNPDHRAWLDYMPGSDIPVIRQPFQQGDLLPYWCIQARVDEHQLYDIGTDPSEQHNLVGQPAEQNMIEMLRVALKEVEAPAEQFERLGIA
ncbi:MAG: sulfatase [Pseudomonadales bacterium]|nr:sulfatase [Pseudomonadales bacterium]